MGLELLIHIYTKLPKNIKYNAIYEYSLFVGHAYAPSGALYTRGLPFRNVRVISHSDRVFIRELESLIDVSKLYAFIM